MLNVIETWGKNIITSSDTMMEYLCSRWDDEKLYKGKVQTTRLKYDIYIWPYSEKRKTSETKNARLACPFRYQYGSIRRICRLP